MKGKEILIKVIPAGVSHAITALGALFLQWLLARQMPIDSVGLFFALVTIVMTVDLLVRFGVEQTVFREGGHYYLSGDRTSFRGVLLGARRFILRRGLIGAVVVAALAYPIDRWFLNADRDYVPILIVAALVPFYSLAIPWAASLRCRGLTALAPFWGPGGIAAVTALLLIVIWGYENPGVATAVATYAVAGVALAIPFLSLRQRNSSRVALAHAGDYGITQICQFLIQWGVLLVVAGLGPPSEVAVLNAALRVAAIINFVLMIFNGVFAPRYANLHKSGSIAELETLARKATRIMTAIALVPFLAIVLFGDVIVLQFGEQYRDALPLLRIVAVAQFLNVLAGPVLNILNMSGHQRDVKRITMVSGLGVLLVSVPVYMAFGLIGMACVIAGGIILNNLLAVFTIKARLGFIPIR